MKKDSEAKKPKRDIWDPRDPNEPPLTPGSHEQLWQIAVRLPTDFEPYGQRKRENFSDCSCSCRWFLPLVAMPLDWGVCANPASPRVALLTFEHQGCPQFEYDAREEEVNTESTPPEGFDTTRFEIAPTDVVDSYDRELYRLLVLIAETSEPDDPEGWAQSCCVSDERWFGIFIAF
jgi:hypothetical protein